jgi:hypothetical protein
MLGHAAGACERIDDCSPKEGGAFLARPTILKANAVAVDVDMPSRSLSIELPNDSFPLPVQNR